MDNERYPLRPFGRQAPPSTSDMGLGKRLALANAPKEQTPPTPPPLMDDLIAEDRAVALLTPGEAAGKLGVGIRTLERWRSTGEGPLFIRLSRKSIRYTENALRDFVNASVRQNTAQ